MAKKSKAEEITETVETVETPVEEKVYIATVTANRLNVRKKPAITSDVIKVLNKDEQVRVCPEKVNNFYELVEGGFIMASYAVVK